MNFQNLVVVFSVLVLLPFAQAAGDPMDVETSLDPRVVTAGGRTEITLTARSGGAPLSEVALSLVADGGAFAAGGRSTAGTTDAQGILRAVWQSGPPGNYPREVFHVVDFTATKDGYPPTTGRLLIRVVPASQPADPAPPTLLVVARADPSVVEAGGVTIVHVQVHAYDATPGSAPPARTPVSNVRVAIHADGGAFAATGGPDVRGETDAAGLLQVRWATNPASAYRGTPTFHMLRIAADREGFQNARAQLEIAVTPAAGPSAAGGPPGRTLFVGAEAAPASIPLGGETTITVLVRADGPGGAPLGGAHVNVLSASGQFVSLGGAVGNVAAGTTDAAGRFRTVWRASGMAQPQGPGGAHPLRIVAGHAGFEEGQAFVHVRLTPAAPPSLAPSGLGLEVRIEPPVVVAGGYARVAAHVHAADGTPVAGAVVRMSAGGGSFEGFPGPTAEGRSGPDGMFRAVWRTANPSAYAADLEYVIEVTAVRPGAGEARGSGSLRVTPATGATPAAPPSPPLVVTATANPTAVAPGGAATIRVAVRTPNGDPARGAEVEVAVGGGSFPQHRGGVAKGSTGRDGVFSLVWQAPGQDAVAGGLRYAFEVVARQSGFGEGRTQVTIPVEAQAPPDLQTMNLLVQAIATRTDVPAGGTTTVRVTVLGTDRRPVHGAVVEVAAGGGTFEGSGGSSVSGRTDPDGTFDTTWATNEASAYTGVREYLFEVTARKPGVGAGTAQVAVRVLPGASAPQASAMQVSVTIPKGTVPAGSTLLVSVHVQGADGKPLDGATIDLLAGSGAFVGTNTTHAAGRTGGSGLVTALWRTDTASHVTVPTPCEFVATVTKPGFATAVAKASVTVQPLDIR